MDIEFKPEGTIITPIDAFPRPTTPVVTPPAPVAVEKQPETIVTPTIEPTPSVVTPEPVVPVVETPVTPTEPVVPTVETPAQPVTPTAKEPKPEIDHKKKFADSTRRNQIVESKFSELQKVLGDITKQEVPTDDEMKVLVPDWEYLTDREQNGERRYVVLERRQNHMLATFSSITAETEMFSKVEDFATGEPRLAGQESEFYEFVLDPRNKGATLEVLVNAFLFENTPAVEDNQVVTPPPVVETPPSMERGNPSGNMPPIQTGNQEKSPEELKLLRTSDPRKYNDMVRKGQI